jgi:hypothetical protein
MNSFSIIHENILTIATDYDRVKYNIQEHLKEWPDLYVFDDANNQIRYKTEGPLIPEDNGKIPILILLSNPHPHSVRQGMFLSPNRIGRENPFWETLRGTGYFNFKGPITPQGMIQNKYISPFRFFMAVLFPFPTEDPTHLIDFFGVTEYNKMIVDGRGNIKKLLTDQNIYSIICFGKTQHDIISNPQNRADSYISTLKEGNIIQEKIWFSDKVSVYLTYPTGWRFVKNYKTFKNNSLKQIFDFIIAHSTSRHLGR